jgi:hypothetical protein
MSIDRRLLNWGVFLVLLGGIPLAVNQGWLDRSALSDLWRLWPFLLIGAGVGLILARTPLAAVGGVVVACTFGVILGGLLAGGFALAIPGCGTDGNLQRVAERAGTFAGTATVTLELDCGRLTVGAVEGSGWHVTADATDASRAPAIDSSPSQLSVRPASDGRVWIFPFTNGGAQAWQVDLPRATTIVLGATVNAGDATLHPDGADLHSVELTLNAGRTVLDLEAARVDRLSATVNAGELRLSLPSSGTTGSITANVGSVRLCAPPGVGLRLDASGGFASSNDFAKAGLVEEGGAWVSAGYASAGARVDLRLIGNAASFSLNPGEGCR